MNSINTAIETQDRFEKLIVKTIEIYKRAARVRKIKWTLADNTARRLLIGDCYYCGCTHGINNKSGLNGIDRVNNSLGYCLNNCVSCCGICNMMKGQLSEADFINQCAKILAYRFS